MPDTPHQIPIAPRFGSTSRALIVDAHVTARNILSSHLRRLGIGQVVQCSRAGEAMAQLEAREFDILLCEHRLADGRLAQDLIDEVRRRRRLPLGTVVVMLTAEAAYDVVAGVAESALDGFLIKPYSPGDLEDRLMRAFVRKAAMKPVFDAVATERWADALALCEERFGARSRHWTTAARIGAEIAIRLGRLPLASGMYEAVLEDKAVPWAKLGLARTLSAADKPGEAVSTLENLLALEPAYADAYDVLGKIFVEQGDYAAALKAYRQAAEITPNSVLRVQRYGIVAHYAGQAQVAQQALERAAGIGAESPSFDHQALLLLALAQYRRGSAEGLARQRELLQAALTRERPAHAQDAPARRARLQRLCRSADALAALLAGNGEAALAGLRSVAAGRAEPGFDTEAAVNLLTLTAVVTAAGVEFREAEAWARETGLRFCVSKQVTEVLVRACEGQDALSSSVRAAQAEVGEISRVALGEGLEGQHRRAVERLLDAATRTLNLKLADLAAATLKRYEDRIDDADVLRDRCVALKALCGAASGGLLADDPDRPAGGLALGALAPPVAEAALPQA